MTKPVTQGGKGFGYMNALDHCRNVFGNSYLSINSINNFRKLIVTDTLGTSRGHHVDRKFRDFVYNRLRFKAVYTEYKKFRNTDMSFRFFYIRIL